MVTLMTASKSEVAYQLVSERINTGAYSPGTVWCLALLPKNLAAR